MIGFCLAAGAGTRLIPLTRVVPKPLLAPAGRPLVDLAVEALLAAGATRVVVNAHHGANLLTAHLTGRPEVAVVVEPALLGTGGALVNAAHLGLLGTADDPVLVTAADHVLDPADLAALATFLEHSNAPMVAGLVPAGADPFGLRLEGMGDQPVRGGLWAAASPSSRGGLWTAASPSPRGGLASPTGGPAAEARGSGVPAGEGPPAGEAAPAEEGAPAGGRVVRDPESPWDSAGAYALRAGLLLDLEPGPATLVARVLGPLLERDRLGGLPFRRPVADAGTLDRLLDVSAGLLAGRWPYELPPGRLVGRAAGRPAGDAGPARAPRPAGHRADGPPGVILGPVFIAVGAEVDPAAVLAGPVVLDAGCRVGAGAVVTRSVIGPGAVVGAGARVVGSFLGSGARVPPATTVTAALVPGPTRDPERGGDPAG